MTTTAVTEPSTSVRGRPSYSAANIRTWIGFKQFAQLAEEAVVQWFRDSGYGPGTLFHAHGLGLSIVDSSLRLPAVLEVDDVVTVTAEPLGAGRLSVRGRVERLDGTVATVMKGQFGVRLVEEGGGTSAPSPLPADLEALRTPSIERPADDGVPPTVPLEAGRSAAATLEGAIGAPVVRSWRLPYYACQYSERAQHAGWVAVLEDVVDRYLSRAGLGVGRLLDERGWIPVVSRARTSLLADARMDETIHATFLVDDILKRTTFDGRMDCWAERDGVLVRVATGRILHGYALSRGPDAGTLAALDSATIVALRS